MLEALKSWWVIVQNTGKCFGCAYCIISQRKDLGGMYAEVAIGDLPSKYLGDRGRDIPVVIDNYFGDPSTQQDHLRQALMALKEDGHRGPIGIITKGKFGRQTIDLLASIPNVVVLQSISGLPRSIEPAKLETRVENMRRLVEAGIKTIAYLRPIIAGYNDSPESLQRVLNLIKLTGVDTVVYSGFRITEETRKLMEANGIDMSGFKEDPEHKQMPEEAREFIETYGHSIGLKVFRKTSCGVSYLLGTSDYNAHWSNPTKYECQNCPNLGKCLPKLKSVAVRESVCKPKCPHQCSSCPFLKDNQVHLTGKWTLGELSVARWILGQQVTAGEIINTPGILNVEKLRNLKKEVK